MLTPGISILLPVHGQAPFLAETLESILRQECQERIELIVALDKPAQEVIMLLGNLTQIDVTLVNVQQSGIAHAHNTALNTAQYDLVAVIHADDVMLPGRLEAQSRFLRMNNQVVCVGGQLELIDETGSYFGRQKFLVSRVLLKIYARYMSPVPHPGSMYRTQVAKDVGGYRQDYAPAEDYDLWLRMMKIGDFYNLPKNVIQYRKHNGQISHQEKAKQSRKYAEAILASRRHLYPDNIHKKKLLIGNQTRERLTVFDSKLHNLSQRRKSKSRAHAFKLHVRLFLSHPYLFCVHATNTIIRSALLVWHQFK